METKLKLYVKKLNDKATLPTKAYDGDAGWDLYCSETCFVGFEAIGIKTSISVKIPDGYFGMIKPKSGLAIKHGINVLAGVIDSGFSGEVVVVLTSEKVVEVQEGQKIAQMVILPVPDMVVEEVEELPLSERGDKGFGSSGK